ncbi:MAG: Rrf2 family transcriptional regulator [Deltaproteobacteria bacterium]|nr:Rrf2 family transcriptional regulator [Deltaproteobacteria bacterium]
MKITALEEYGLRCLLQLARGQKEADGSLSIRTIAEREGLSIEYVSKITAQLRKAGLIESTRGIRGGYRLRNDASHVTLWHASQALSQTFFNSTFCMDHAGDETECVHHKDCSIRSVWNVIADRITQVMRKITLEDLLSNESKTDGKLMQIIPPKEKINPKKRINLTNLS